MKARDWKASRYLVHGVVLVGEEDVHRGEAPSSVIAEHE